MNIASPGFALPSFADAIIRAVAQKGLTAAATAMTGAGLLPIGLQGQFIAYGIAGVLWLASFAWTYVHERANHQTIVAAFNSPAPNTVTVINVAPDKAETSGVQAGNKT
jgi:hypothetical protein